MPLKSVTWALFVTFRPPQYTPGSSVIVGVILPSILRSRLVQLGSGGGAREASGSGITGQSVVGALRHLIPRPTLYPPAEQTRSANTEALSSTCRPLVSDELDWI